MPIRINLLAEALAAEDLRRRDPVKRAIFLGLFLVALSLVYYSSVWLEYMIEKKGLSQVQTEIQARTNDFAQVQSSLKKISETQHRIDALQQLSAARFLQGNLMNALQQTYVPNVQLNHLRVEQNYTATAAVAAKTNNFGVIPGHPPVVTEHVVLTLDAKDFSPNPGDQVNHFKDAILKQEYFKPSIDPTNGIRLSSLSSLLIPADSKPFVQFTLECRFLDRKSTP
jgi:hypothetical protein